MDNLDFSTLQEILEVFEIAKQQDKEIKWLSKILLDFKDYYAEICQLWKKKLNEFSSQNDELKSQVADLEYRLNAAHKRLCEEKQKLPALIKERNSLLHQLNTVKDILNDDNDKFHNETKEKLSFLNNAKDNCGNDKLDTIIELDSTDYLMSELSYTLDDDEDSGTDKLSPRRSHRSKRPPIRYPSEDNLDISKPKKRRGKHSASYTADPSEHVIATTTVTVPQVGPVTAKSTIETKPCSSRDLSLLETRFLPSAPPLTLIESDSDATSLSTPKKPFSCRTNIKLHNWTQKSHIMGDSCAVCTKKIKFSMMIYKCLNCKAVAHNHCKDNVPVPCVPVCVNTPQVKTCKAGFISDFVPATSPMVPSLVVHCIREIEARGFSEVGLYRIPGSDKEVKALKEKLIKARGVIDLSGIPDIHVVCGCLKEFLRSLKEPLIPQSKWKPLALAADIPDGEQKKNKFYQIIQDLPQANRDTLAYIILHLQKVSAAPKCKMPVSNLSKMFGPSIVGYSVYKPENMLLETNISNKVMAELILLPVDCWEQWLNSDSENQNPDIYKTPSQDSVHGFFSNSSSSIKTVRKFKFFNTP